MASIPIHLPTEPILFSRGVCSVEVCLNHFCDFAKFCVHACGGYNCFASAVSNDSSSENHVLFVIKLSFFSKSICYLAGGIDSPVNAASSTLRLKASIILESAGTLSPVYRKIMSPGTSSTGWHFYFFAVTQNHGCWRSHFL